MSRMKPARFPRKGRTENEADMRRSARAKEDATARLRVAGLRPTRQRVMLAGLLFRGHDRHLTAETLHEEAVRAGAKVSLATVYNTLNQFTDAGLLRQVAVDAGRSWFDTNVDEHQHFYIEYDATLIDIPGAEIDVAGVPPAPRGMKVSSVDIVVRLKRA